VNLKSSCVCVCVSLADFALPRKSKPSCTCDILLEKFLSLSLVKFILPRDSPAPRSGARDKQRKRANAKVSQKPTPTARVPLSFFINLVASSTLLWLVCTSVRAGLTNQLVFLGESSIKRPRGSFSFCISRQIRRVYHSCIERAFEAARNCMKYSSTREC
jgi:hypothetical protein